MTSKSRLAAFGGSGLLVFAGIACAVATDGVMGPLLALILIGTGLVLATSLVFLEVGLSEDRDRERELKRRETGAAPGPGRVRFGRLRDHR